MVRFGPSRILNIVDISLIKHDTLTATTFKPQRKYNTIKNTIKVAAGGSLRPSRGVSLLSMGFKA